MLAEFVPGAQAASAHLDPLALTIDHYGNGLDIRQPAAVGTAFRMADVVPKLWTFATDLTLCHLRHLFLVSSLGAGARRVGLNLPDMIP